MQPLAAAGIELFGGQAGTVREAIERFEQRHLSPTSEANVDSLYKKMKVVISRIHSIENQ